MQKQKQTLENNWNLSKLPKKQRREAKCDDKSPQKKDKNKNLKSVQHFEILNEFIQLIKWNSSQLLLVNST